MLPDSPSILLGALPDLENDCACPTPPDLARSAPLAGGPYMLAPDLHREALTQEWTLFCNALAGGAPAVLNEPGRACLAGFERPKALETAEDRLLAAARLIVPPGTSAGPPTDPPTTLTAWLHVTNACNLECPYCYVRKSAERMSFESGSRAISALIATARRRDFSTIKLKYAGGEAGLHYRMVQCLHEEALARAGEHGIALRAVVLSNGTVMPPAFAEWLASSGVRLMLSLDGVGADHDAQRPWKGRGAGAFAAVERTLEAELRPRGISPDICITVTGRSAQLAHRAVRWAIERDLPFSLNFYRESEQSAGLRELRYEEQQIIDGMLAAYAVVEELLPERPLLDGLLDRVQARAHGHTCGVGRNYVVITHTGAVAQCQMDLGAPMPIGPDDDLIPLVAAGPIHNLSADDKEGCRDCRWRYRCAGGCPIVTLRATGRFDVKSPNCAIIQTLLPAALRLEGLRVLKHHSAQACSA